MYKIGFIGSGKMAGAIIKGLIKTSFAKPEELIATQAETEGIDEKSRELGIKIILDNKELAQNSEVIFIATKPNQAADVLEEIKPFITSDKLIASIAAGVTTEKLESHLPENTRVIRIMPNTPAMVGEGVLLFEEKNSLLEEERAEVKKLFEALGIVIELPVHLMGIGGALTGCGPAFIDLIIEALGDAGVKYGVPRKQAYEMVSQMILGSAKLQLETGEHPGVLKDNVCSPAGTTICGVDALEHAGIRAGFIDAIDAIMNK